MTWDPGQYLDFAGPRLRPALELLGRVGASEPAFVIDAGCGPGNVTEHLGRRWPHAMVTGIDNSPEMLERAKADYPHMTWVEADLAAFDPPQAADVVFSNATLHWLDDHGRVFLRLAGWVGRGGWLAIQMPRNHGAPSHRCFADTVRDGPWTGTLEPILREWPVAEPAFYHDLLAPRATELDMWETEYLHVLEGEHPVVEWTKGSLLRPALSLLAGPQAEEFEAAYRERIAAAYPPRVDGKTLFPFRRLFIVARF